MVTTYLYILLALSNYGSLREEKGLALVSTIAVSFLFNFSKFASGIISHIRRVLRRKALLKEKESMKKVVRMKPMTPDS